MARVPQQAGFSGVCLFLLPREAVLRPNGAVNTIIGLKLNKTLAVSTRSPRRSALPARAPKSPPWDVALASEALSKGLPKGKRGRPSGRKRIHVAVEGRSGVRACANPS